MPSLTLSTERDRTSLPRSARDHPDQRERGSPTRRDYQALRWPNRPRVV